MTKFTTRVELHDADSSDYDTLHAEMTLQGFTNTMKVGGKLLKLPTAEYNFEGNNTQEEVLALAEVAAGETGNKYAVLVTQSAGRICTGLKVA